MATKIADTMSMTNNTTDKQALMPLAEVAEIYTELNDRPLSYQTLRNWIRKGVRGVCCFGDVKAGKIVTSLEAVAEFEERLRERCVAVTPAQRDATSAAARANTQRERKRGRLGAKTPRKPKTREERNG